MRENLGIEDVVLVVGFNHPSKVSKVLRALLLLVVVILLLLANVNPLFQHRWRQILELVFIGGIHPFFSSRWWILGGWGVDFRQRVVEILKLWYLVIIGLGEVNFRLRGVNLCWWRRVKTFNMWIGVIEGEGRGWRV